MSEKNKKRWKVIGVTALTAVLGGLFSMNSSEFYGTLVKPPFAPPSWVFPVFWGILYVLMAISLIVYLNKEEQGNVFTLYVVNLVLNALWPLFFFSFEMICFSVFILLALLVVNFILLGDLKEVKASFYLYLPYIIWQVFALYLNISVCLLN